MKEPGFTAVLDTQIAEGGENFPRIDANEKVPVEQVAIKISPFLFPYSMFLYVKILDKWKTITNLKNNFFKKS